MAYLLDTNAFIQARRSYYGMDFCPAYWDWLVQANGAGRVSSIERVGDEIGAGDDELVAWAEHLGDSFFLKPDQAVVNSLAQVSKWVAGGSYEPSAVALFLDVADSYLVAHAHAYGHTVVTHERVQTSAKNVKIPNACVAMNVKYVNTFEMLRKEKVRFVLEVGT